MLLVQNPCHNPAFNLALEEYLLTRRKEELFCLWRNGPSVILGRNQNAIEEIDTEYVKQHNISVIRRQTGGGAVFHDLGNLNYTFIEAYNPGDFNNYAKFTAPVRDYLQSLGVDAQLSGRNDLTVEGRKVSGNAQTVKNGRIMHHGTLLFSADMSHLVAALRPKPLKIESKGIKSLRSRVANLVEFLPGMDIEAFTDGLQRYLLQTYPQLRSYTLNPEELAEVEKLVEEKYSRWEWNIGESPAYNLSHSARFEFGTLDMCLEVQGGVIEKARIFGDFFGLEDIAPLEQALAGVRHTPEAVLAALQGQEVGRYISGMSARQLAELTLGITN